MMLPIRDVIPTRTTPVVTLAIIALNTLVFLALRGWSHADAQAVAVAPAVFTLWRSVGALFVHDSLLALTLNMLVLWVFGENIEERLGRLRFTAFYIACGATGLWCAAAAQPLAPAPIGSSGAVMGVAGAYFLMFPQSRILTLVPLPPFVIELHAIFVLVAWTIVQFFGTVGVFRFLGLADPSGGIALWALTISFALGMGLGWLLRRRDRVRVDWWSP